VRTTPRKEEVWTPPGQEEEATGVLRAGHLQKFSPSKKKRLTTGVGYSGRAALRREQCDMHAIGLRNIRCLVTARQATEDVVVTW
jgi:hypothetical protein